MGHRFFARRTKYHPFRAVKSGTLDRYVCLHVSGVQCKEVMVGGRKEGRKKGGNWNGGNWNGGNGGNLRIVSRAGTCALA